MIYIVFFTGLICGFFLGQMILLRLLRGVSNEELLNNKGLQWRYGLLNWLIAIFTAASALWLYEFHFLR